MLRFLPMSYDPQQPRRGRFILAPIIIAILFICFQYFSAETYINPETGKEVRVGINPEQEQALGLQSFSEVLSQSNVIQSGAAYNMVQNTARRLINVVDNESRNFEWDAKLIDSKEINAFCLPGGKIAVYTGIIPVARTEDGLAAVMGHEIAHATARHGAQRILRQNLIQTGLLGLQGAVSQMDNEQRRVLLGALGAGVQYGLILPYSREHEFEADKIGLAYMIRAGYDPNEAISFWERMAEISKNQPPAWASTHPDHEARIERLKKLIPELTSKQQS
jgi:predicted Zn-dependent protease